MKVRAKLANHSLYVLCDKNTIICYLCTIYEQSGEADPDNISLITPCNEYL